MSWHCASSSLPPVTQLLGEDFAHETRLHSLPANDALVSSLAAGGVGIHMMVVVSNVRARSTPHRNTHCHAPSRRLAAARLDSPAH